MSWSIKFGEEKNPLVREAAVAHAEAASDENMGNSLQTNTQKALVLAALAATPGSHVHGTVAGHNATGGRTGYVTVNLTGVMM